MDGNAARVVFKEAKVGDTAQELQPFSYSGHSGLSK
jgi:hypothetical protein